MNLPDKLLTLANSGESIYKDKGSRFLGFAQRVDSEVQMREWVKQLRKTHPSAAHVCWAFVGGYDASDEYSTDDREPSGSAGKSILKAIQTAGLTFTGVAVVRYFGGKLLGVPGLIQAYSIAATEAIGSAGLEPRNIMHQIFQPCLFERHHEVIRLCKKYHIKFFPDQQQGTSGITFEVSPSVKDELLRNLLDQQFHAAEQLTILDKL